MKKGTLITLEGGEGCGKSTQIKKLYDHLRRKGYSVFMTREPGGTRTGDAIRKILLDPKQRAMTGRCETFLYMASRAQLVAEEILPRIERGQIVLCDRWLDATIAYQGYGGGQDIGWIRDMGCAVTYGIKPKLTLYLDLPVAVGLARAKKRRGSDRIERKSTAFHESVRRGFLRIAQEEPARFKRLALAPKETVAHVFERIQAEVDRVLRGL